MVNLGATNEAKGKNMADNFTSNGVGDNLLTLDVLTFG